MATKFITAGTLPANTSGADLTAGIVGTDGVKRYYGVNRFAAAGSAAFLSDNTSGWTGITGLTVTGNTINVTAAVVMNRVGTPYVAVNKTINISGSGLLAINGNNNNHVYFVNCTFNITATKSSSTSATLGYVAAAGDQSATGRGRNMAISAGEANTATLNLYGCVVNVSSTGQNFNTYIGATDQIATDFWDSDNYADTFGPIFGNGSRWIDVDMLLSANKATSSANFYGAPAVFSGVQLYNQGLGVGNTGVSAAALALTPSFTLPTQTQFMFLNAGSSAGLSPTTADTIVQMVDAPGMGSTTTSVFGTLNGTDGFVGWGGGNAQSDRAQQGYAQYRSIGYGFYSDAAQTAGIPNVRIRAGTNITNDVTQTRWINKFPNTAPGSTTYLQDLLTGANGLPTSEKYSRDSGTSFTTGLQNWGNGTVSAVAVGTTTLFTNPNGLNAPNNVYAIPIQLGRVTSGTAFVSNPTITWTARSFTHVTSEGNNSFAGSSNTARTVYGPVGNKQTLTADATIKSAASAAMLASSNANIDGYFGGVFTAAGFPDSNDVHDVVKYEWFKYTTNANAPVVTNGNISLGSQNLRIDSSSTFPNGYTFDGTTWSFEATAIYSVATNGVPGGVTTTGNINLPTLPSAAAATGRTYATLTGTQIALPAASGTRGAFRLTVGAITSSTGSATFTLNNLPTQLFPTGSVTTNPVTLGTLAATAPLLQTALRNAMPGWSVNVTALTTATADQMVITYSGTQQSGTVSGTTTIGNVTPSISAGYSTSAGFTPQDLAGLLTFRVNSAPNNTSWTATQNGTSVTISSLLSGSPVGRINAGVSPTATSTNVPNITTTVTSFSRGVAGFQIDFELPTTSPSLTIPTTITMTSSQAGYLSGTNSVSNVQNPIPFVMTPIFVPLNAIQLISNVPAQGTVVNGVSVNFGGGDTPVATYSSASFNPQSGTTVVGNATITLPNITGSGTFTFTVTYRGADAPSNPGSALNYALGLITANATFASSGWAVALQGNGFRFTTTTRGPTQSAAYSFSGDASWTLVFSGSQSEAYTNGGGNASAVTMVDDMSFNLANNAVLSGNLALTPGVDGRQLNFTNATAAQVSNLRLTNATPATIITLSGWPAGVSVPTGFQQLATFTLTLTFPTNVPQSAFRVAKIFQVQGAQITQISPAGTGFGSTTVVYTFAINTLNQSIGCVFYVDGFQRATAQTVVGTTSLNVLFTPEQFIDSSLWNNTATATDTAFVNGSWITATNGTLVAPGRTYQIQYADTGYTIPTATSAVGTYTTSTFSVQTGGTYSATVTVPSASGSGTSTFTIAYVASSGNNTQALIVAAVASLFNANTIFADAGWTASSNGGVLTITRNNPGAIVNTTFTVVGDGFWNVMFTGTRTATIVNGVNGLPAGTLAVEWGKNVIRKIEESTNSSNNAFHQSIAVGTVASNVFSYNTTGLQVLTANSSVLSGIKQTSNTNYTNIPLYTVNSGGVNYPLNPAGTSVLLTVDYGGFSPGAVANITTGQQEAIAAVVSDTLVGTQAQPGPLSLVARGVESAQLLVPSTIPIPTS